MKQIEVIGSSVDEAIEAGLKELGLTRDDVGYEVLGQKGFFRKKYRVLLTVKEPAAEKDARPPRAEKPARPDGAVKAEKESRAEKPVAPRPEKKPAAVGANKGDGAQVHREKRGESGEAHEPKKVSEAQVNLAKDYLGKLLSLMNIAAEVRVDTSHGSIDVDLVTEDAAVIGHRGEVLDAMQILCKRAVEEGEDKYVHVNVDSRNYRMQREQALVALAERMAAKCVRTGKKVVLEPMNNTHRKIIHATLSGSDKVFTRSEGREPSRRVVILPKRGQ